MFDACVTPSVEINCTNTSALELSTLVAVNGDALRADFMLAEAWTPSRRDLIEARDATGEFAERIGIVSEDGILQFQTRGAIGNHHPIGCDR